MVLLGITHEDGQEQVDKVVRKIADLRIFEDETSASDNDAPILLISQFTLYGDTRKGRVRPGRRLLQARWPNRSTRPSRLALESAACT